MNPRLIEQVAMLRYQELVALGLHEQFEASVLPTSAGDPTFRIVLKQHLGKVLERVRVRLHDVHAGSGAWLAPGAVGEQAASASSHEPMVWLSPCRLP